MSDIQPGDVVVAIRGAGCPDCMFFDDYPEMAGRYYTVLQVQDDPECLWPGLILRDGPPLTENAVWCGCGFRKIRPASDEFTRTVRACRPIKQREGVS